MGVPRGEPTEGGIFNDEEEEVSAEPAVEEVHGEEGEDPLKVEEGDADESPKDEKEDDGEKWKALIQKEQNFRVGQLTFVEVLPDRKAASVITGISKIHARLRYLGLPLRRLHSDRAGGLR